VLDRRTALLSRRLWIMEEQRYFEDLKLGEKFRIPSKTITDSHFMLFAALTGDSHPLHYDDEYCKKTIFGRKVAHGLMLVAITAFGASNAAWAMEDSMIAALEQGARFLRPVFVGDTLAPELEVAELIPKKGNGIVKVRSTITNQKGELVLEGWHLYLVKSRQGNYPLPNKGPENSGD